MEHKPILDACCGGRMMWTDKTNPNVLFQDNIPRHAVLCDGRRFICEPDIVADFTNMPHEDNTFKLVVFDPPHLLRAGEHSWLKTKYGVLPENWEEYIKIGFDECMRVLENYGVLIFKWSEDQIKTSEALRAIGKKPLFGDRRSKTRWMVFMKGID